MCERMDTLTAARLGKTVTINGSAYPAAETEFNGEMGVLEGAGLHLLVFDSGYRARKGDAVLLDEVSYRVTRHRRYNGKSQVTIERT